MFKLTTQKIVATLLTSLTGLASFTPALALITKPQPVSQQVMFKKKPITNLQDALKIVPSNSHGAAGITITGSGTIHYIRAYFYSNASCSSGLLGSGSIVDNTTGFPFTTGQTIKLTGAAAYNLATSQGITTGSIQCMKLIYTAGNETSDGVNCQTVANYTCTGSSCSTNTSAQSASWATDPSICAPMHLYASQWGNNTVSVCDINSADGGISSCVTTGANFSRPAYTALNNGHAYTPDSSATSKINECTVSHTTGALSSCAQTSSETTNAFKSTINKGTIYIPNLDGTQNGRITECSITAASGAIDICSQTAAGFTDPIAIKINEGRAYVADFANNRVYVCPMTGNNINPSNCPYTEIASGSGETAGITFHYGYAYIPMTGDAEIQKCDINANTGLLESCAALTISGVTLSAPRSITFYNTHAYIANLNTNKVIQCVADPGSNGTIDCTDAPETSITTPYGLSIY